MPPVPPGGRPNFVLSPHQQTLLFAALNSNKTPVSNSPQDNANALVDASAQPKPASGTLSGTDESPFVDYDYEFDGDGSFGDYDFGDASQGEMIGKLPGESPDGDMNSNEKRGLSDDDENDEDGGGKRREGDEKTSKKPGRKPLTSEPTTKRKAQNRAAQRAFRERKEKHLKDLETKVQDLEKASESANHENSILRAQVEKMSAELKEYKKRVEASVNGPARAQTLQSGYMNRSFGNSLKNPGDVNFQFEFPRFGKLPGPPLLDGSASMASPPSSVRKNSNIGNSNPNMQAQNRTFGSSASSVSPLSQPATNDMAEFSGLFSPKTLDTIAKDTTRDYLSHVSSNASRSSFDSIGLGSSGQPSSHNSPASSISNNGPGVSSSCGTSPESYTQSPPAPKAMDSVLTTIGEESTKNNTLNAVNLENFTTPAFDLTGIDWLAEQNGNQFDPQLFGDYREPQDNILAAGLYDDTFFNEAFAMPEFSSPFNLEASPAPPKQNLVKEIDAKLSGEEVIPKAEPQMLSCTSMWEKLQSCPKVQNGEIDMDSLCTQLQQKAKCSGDGPVIQESDFKAVMSSMFPIGSTDGCNF